MEYGLYRIEVSVRDSEGVADRMDMSLTGKLTDAGKAELDEGGDFKGFIDELTLEAAKIMDKWFGDKAKGKDYKGRACEEPAMKAFLESSGAVLRDAAGEEDGKYGSDDKQFVGQ